MTDDAREFDVVLFGATGFTGRLTAEYLAREYGDGSLRWALAGRNAEKLAKVRDEIAAQSPSIAEVPLLVGDSHDRASLDAIAARTRVVCSTVGPYATYGSELVAACVAHGTSYCDLTGEVQWIRRMIDAHHEAASASGARIVHCCGFDSIPSDIGMFVLQEAAIERTGSPAGRVRFQLKKASGGFSGGTVASLLNVLAEAKDPQVRRVLGNPYSLNPEGERKGPDGQDLMRPARDEVTGTWVGPFVMAAINSRVVRRTNALLDYRYGRELRYDEVTCFGRGPAGLARATAMSAGLGAFVAAASVGPTRRALTSTVLPAPGEGPSREAIERGRFRADIIGVLDDGTTLTVRASGDRDPGYGATAGMLAESAVCLALDADELPDRAGVLTPASAMGARLVERLPRAGVGFEIVGG